MGGVIALDLAGCKGMNWGQANNLFTIISSGIFVVFFKLFFGHIKDRSAVYLQGLKETDP